MKTSLEIHLKETGKIGNQNPQPANHSHTLNYIMTLKEVFKHLTIENITPKNTYTHKCSHTHKHKHPTTHTHTTTYYITKTQEQ